MAAYENRNIVSGTSLSAHALGMAIDLNQDDNLYCKISGGSCCGEIGCCKQDLATRNNQAGQCQPRLV